MPASLVTCTNYTPSALEPSWLTALVGDEVRLKLSLSADEANQCCDWWALVMASSVLSSSVNATSSTRLPLRGDEGGGVRKTDAPISRHGLEADLVEPGRYDTVLERLQ